MQKCEHNLHENGKMNECQYIEIYDKECMYSWEVGDAPSEDKVRINCVVWFGYNNRHRLGGAISYYLQELLELVVCQNEL